MTSKSTRRGKGKPPDLFSVGAAERREPLAERMRPRNFSEFIGQQHIVGPGRLLRRAIEADKLSSIILYGPAGVGKTTIANIIAHETSAEFVTLNAVLDGIKELRDVIEKAEAQFSDKKTVVFVDEIHRWNKNQQDGLLPHVEAGTIILVGATTENPFFSLVGPLVSRSRLFKLEPLTDDDIRAILLQALSDPERGYGALNVSMTPDALDHLVTMAGGDARDALNALELAVQTTPADPKGSITVDLAIAVESIQRRYVRYDRGADEHYDTISAFIKSLRGSDANAALYWMAKMLVAGEEPRFIFRRLLILACEDVGLADPQAIVVVNAAAEAFERVGMPEGNYFLSSACLYIATAPKSNTAGAIFQAIAHIEQHGADPVPAHLRDKTSNAAAARHDESENPSEQYKYPHDYPDAWVDQQYLPDGMATPDWYVPKLAGYERIVYEKWLTQKKS